MDIDKLEAGRELDALIAERVMGCKTGKQGTAKWNYVSCECSDRAHEDTHFYKGRLLCYYSTDIAAAWQVLCYLDEQGWQWAIYAENPGYSIDLRLRPCDACSRNSGSVYVLVKAKDQIPLAICRAALKAIGATDEPS